MSCLVHRSGRCGFRQRNVWQSVAGRPHSFRNDQRRELLRELLGKYVDYDIVSLEEGEFEAFLDFVDPGEAVLKALTQYEFILWTRERFTAFKSRPERLEDVDFEYQWDD